MLQHVRGARQRKRSTWMNDPLSAAMQPHVDPNVRIHSCPGPRDQHMAEASRTINWKAIDDDGDLFPKRGYCVKDSFIDIDEVTRDAGGSHRAPSSASFMTDHRSMKLWILRYQIKTTSALSCTEMAL